MERFQNYINGEWREPSGGQYYTRCNPADFGDVIGQFPMSTEQDVADAVSAAKEAFRTWGKTTPGQRATYLEKFGRLVSEHTQEIGEAVCREVGKTLVESLVKYMDKLVVGNSMTPGVTMGPMQSEKAGNKVLEYINIGLKEGAQLVKGGHRMTGEKYDKGMFIEPTLFTNVTPDMTIAKQEIFGPVLCVITVDSIEEAIDVANNVEYGLSAMIFSDDMRCVHEFTENVQAGMVHVNHGSVTDAYMPFGGVKHSGLGQFSKGRTNRDFFTNFKVKYTKRE